MDRSEDDNGNEDEFRLALMHFHGDSIEIATYWVERDKFAMLRAALGEPQVDSVYDRETVENNTVEGAHFFQEDDDESGA
jgi:hypothetical protein